MRLWILLGFCVGWIGCAKSETPVQGAGSARAASSQPKVGAAPAPGEGEDWPAFMGPRHDGTSLETGLLKSWPPEGPPKVWERDLGRSYSAPVTTRGRLIVFHRLGNEEVVEALDAKTGKPIWESAYPTRYVDRYGYNKGPRSSPAIDGDRVYTFGAEGTLSCFDFGSGDVIWQRPINKDYNVAQNFFGVGTAPVIDGDLILLNAGGRNGAGIIAVDKKSGKTVWETSNDEASYSTPRIAAIGGRRMGIFFTRQGLLVADVATGEQITRYPFRSKINESVNAAMPVVIEDYVFLSATYNTGAVLLRLEADGLKEIWKDRLAMQNHWATSIHHQGYLYGMDGRHESGSNFRCIDFMTGEVRWKADEGLGRAAFIMAEGNLIAIGERGILALIEVNPDRYIEIARAKVLNPRFDCYTPPVLSHGLLYVRNEIHLVCLDLRNKKS